MSVVCVVFPRNLRARHAVRALAPTGINHPHPPHDFFPQSFLQSLTISFSLETSLAMGFLFRLNLFVSSPISLLTRCSSRTTKNSLANSKSFIKFEQVVMPSSISFARFITAICVPRTTACIYPAIILQESTGMPTMSSNFCPKPTLMKKSSQNGFPRRPSTRPFLTILT
ncbi:hypothetical protein BC827DRAFT_1245608 [Russula dissimulans]|nr:hypothetical protein BC827DRAFT_1245608 [Russula dissimulans]